MENLSPPTFGQLFARNVSPQRQSTGNVYPEVCLWPIQPTVTDDLPGAGVKSETDPFRRADVVGTPRHLDATLPEELDNSLFWTMLEAHAKYRPVNHAQVVERVNALFYQVLARLSERELHALYSFPGVEIEIGQQPHTGFFVIVEELVVRPRDQQRASGMCCGGRLIIIDRLFAAFAPEIVLIEVIAHELAHAVFSSTGWKPAGELNEEERRIYSRYSIDEALEEKAVNRKLAEWGIESWLIEIWEVCVEGAQYSHSSFEQLRRKTTPKLPRLK